VVNARAADDGDAIDTDTFETAVAAPAGSATETTPATEATTTSTRLNSHRDRLAPRETHRVER
jgi:hypothetical protein